MRKLEIETIPYQGNSPKRASAPYRQPNSITAIIEHAGSLRQAFPLLIPPKPYCADYLPGFLKIRSRRQALKRRLIQLNSNRVFAWLPFDIDRPGAYFAAEDANLPPPNYVAINPENGHSLTAYLLKDPVQNFAGSRQSPLHYMAAVERGMRHRLGADRGYTGTIAKNPLHTDWRVEWQAPQPYDLGYLASELSKDDMRSEFRREDETGLGRNCSVFDDAREWAYHNVLKFKREVGCGEAWQQRCIDIALSHNCVFAAPMTYAEVRNIGKSIAKWTWQRFNEGTFSRIQSLRVQHRWFGHVTATAMKPWKAMGISRATYYRRKTAGVA
jgi:hypothetical protein